MRHVFAKTSKNFKNTRMNPLRRRSSVRQRRAMAGRAEWHYPSCPAKSLKNPANYQATKIYEGAEKTGGNSPQGEGLKIGFPPLRGRMSIIRLQRVRHGFIKLTVKRDVGARCSEGRLAQRVEWGSLVGPALGVLEILLKLPPITEVVVVGFSSQLERPPAYKPQAKAHRADKPQPLPAVESHVESRSNRSTQSGTAPERAKGLLNTSCHHGRGPDLHYGGDRGAKIENSFEPLPKEARLTFTRRARIAPIPRSPAVRCAWQDPASAGFCFCG